MKSVRAIDIARSIAICCILAAHADQVYTFIRYIPKPYYRWVERWTHVIGNYGVSVFIVVSGFSLAYALSHKTHVRWREWFKKRAIRVYVPLWISLSFFLLVFTYGHAVFPVIPQKTITAGELLATLSGLQAFMGYGGGGINPVNWFHSLIIGLYALFPVLWWAVRRNTSRLLLPALFILQFVLGVIVIDHSLPLFRHLPFTRLFEFVTGMVLARAYVHNTSAIQLLKRTRSLALVASVLLMSIFAVYVLCDAQSVFYVLLIITSGPLLFLLSLGIDFHAPMPPFLERIVSTISQYSQTLFLFHLPFLSLYHRMDISPVIFILLYSVVMGATMVVAQKLSAAVQSRFFASSS